MAFQLSRLKIRVITSDRYGAELTAQAFRNHGIRYTNSTVPSGPIVFWLTSCGGFGRVDTAT